MSHLQNHLQLFHVLESLWKTILRLETNLEEGKAVLVPVGEGIFVCVCVCMCVCVCVQFCLARSRASLPGSVTGYMVMRAGRKSTKKLCLGSRKLLWVWMLGSISWGCMDLGIMRVKPSSCWSEPFALPRPMLSEIRLYPLRARGNLTLLSGVLWTRWRQVTECHLKPRLSVPHPGKLPALLPGQVSPRSLLAACPHPYFKSSVKSSYLKGGFVLVLPGGWGGRQILGDLILPSCRTWINGKDTHHQSLKTLEPRELS